MKYREIGSEFWNIPTGDENHLFNNSTEWFISGRAALDFILRDIKTYKDIKTALMPSWCCDTMLDPFIRNDIEVSFYEVVYQEGKLVKKINGQKADVLLDMDYFGYEAVNDLDFNGIIIKDASHSIFVKEDWNSGYVFGSLRKWAGFKTGGFAYSATGFKLAVPAYTNEEYVARRTFAMSLKENYINGLSDDKGYLAVYGQAEDSLENLYDLKGYEEDIEAAKHFDIAYVRNKRRANAKVLIEGLKDYLIFKEIGENDCPLFVPIMVDDRNGLRRYLIERSIYCPIHWPISPLHQLTAEGKEIYDHELSLICDQRYDIEDMEEILFHINNYLREQAC